MTDKRGTGRTTTQLLTAIRGGYGQDVMFKGLSEDHARQLLRAAADLAKALDIPVAQAGQMSLKFTLPWEQVRVAFRGPGAEEAGFRRVVRDHYLEEMSMRREAP